MQPPLPVPQQVHRKQKKTGIRAMERTAPTYSHKSFSGSICVKYVRGEVSATATLTELRVDARPGLLGATLTGVFLAGDFPRAGDFLRAGDLPRAGDCAGDLPRAAGAGELPREE
eukprot:CAMPEP_0173088484 /NCGR_PEP_ID=MMETSP1102-20130122/24979_1 /TAXON_ID=49646 /ORGANISM="Geminigera sp., Strain Caron Lab Isolate" /LENGTH=114 /DNA_ID=CAMNT_0013971431 /DNA_START=311 /DNA_END=655 /DNA_ORIENTATION=+